jgi:hypothetical protein
VVLACLGGDIRDEDGGGASEIGWRRRLVGGPLDRIEQRWEKDKQWEREEGSTGR